MVELLRQGVALAVGPRPVRPGGQAGQKEQMGYDWTAAPPAILGRRYLSRRGDTEKVSTDP